MTHLLRPGLMPTTLPVPEPDTTQPYDAPAPYCGRETAWRSVRIEGGSGTRAELLPHDCQPEGNHPR